MHRFFLFSFCFGLFLKAFQAQTPTCPQAQARENMHINHLRMPNIRPGGVMSNYPQFEENTVSAGFDGEPKPAAGLFASALWVGGTDENGQVKVAANRHGYGESMFFAPGPLQADGSLNPDNCAIWDRFWSITRPEIDAFRSDFADNGQLQGNYPHIMAWPGRGNPHFAALHGFDLPSGDLAPFFDQNADGLYNPLDGDFPHPPNMDVSRIPGKILWTLFNDQGKHSTYAEGLHGLGFEFQTTVWAYACVDTNNALNDAVFFAQKITNRSNVRVDSVVAGIWNDFDLGSVWDDYFGTNPDLASIYAYHPSNHDPQVGGSTGPFFGENPPVFSLTFLNKPLYKSIIFVISGVCDPITQYLSPVSSAEHYNFLNGHWRTGEPLVYGDVGYSSDTTAQETSFLYPDAPTLPTGWHMLNTNFLCVKEHNHLGSTRLRSLLPGQSDTIIYMDAFHRGPGLSNFENVHYMFDRVADLRNHAAAGFPDACVANFLCQDDCVWAGDANTDGRVDHLDLLPIGLNFGKTGQKRLGFVAWEPRAANDWGQTPSQGFDLKHIDANGDSRLNLTDGKVVEAFLHNTRPDFETPADEYPAGTELFLKFNGASGVTTENLLPNQNLAIRVGFDTLEGLAAFAFSLEFDTAYFQFYQTPPATLFKFDSSKIYCQITQAGQIDWSQVWPNNPLTSFGGIPSGFQTIFRSKTPPANASNITFMRLKNIKAYRSDGSEMVLGSWPLRFCFYGGCATDLTEPGNLPRARVIPNPASTQFRVESPGAVIRWLALCDASGKTRRAVFLAENATQAEFSAQGLPSGFYFLKIATEAGLLVEKIVLENR